MQENFDFYTLIIVITFLGILLLLAYYINKKKDFFKSHLNKNKSIALINSSILGGGNRVILFEVYKNKYLVVSNKSNISNILPLVEENSNHISEKKLWKFY